MPPPAKGRKLVHPTSGPIAWTIQVAIEAYLSRREQVVALCAWVHFRTTGTFAHTANDAQEIVAINVDNGSRMAKPASRQGNFIDPSIN